MSRFYAQLNENGIVHTVCQLSGEVEDDNIVEISSMDNRLIGKKYKNEKFYGLKLEPEKEKIEANEEVKVSIKWQDLEENLVDDNTEITVFVNDEEKTKLTAENGIAEIDLSSDESGIFEIKVVCEDGCKARTRIGVVESG